MDQNDSLPTAELGATRLAEGGAGTAEQRETDVLASYPGMQALQGPWRLRQDPSNIGKAEAWYQNEPSDEPVRVTVPACWQESVDYSGGVAWYFKDFQVPVALQGQLLRLKFWAVDYGADVWVNGQFCGHHEGGFTPFELDITKQATVGQENRLAVRVVDPPRPPHRSAEHSWPGTMAPGESSVDGFTFMEIPMGLQSWIEGFTVGGIWQPVELLSVPRLHISDIFVEPKLDAGALDAHVEITIAEPEPADVTVRAVVTPWQDTLQAMGEAERVVSCSPGKNTVDLYVPVRAPRAWSPEDPYLYVAEITIERAVGPVHRASTRFGLREFTVKDGYFHLNGQRIVIKGGHFQGTYPTTLAFPPTRAFAYQDMRLMKEAGFNFVRLWGKPTPAWVLDAADELGLLLQEEPPLSVMEDSEQLLPRATREVSELVTRDRNRPAIVIWNMINELAPATKIVQQLCRTARALDPTRLITENNGGHSRYYLPYAADGVPYLTEHSYPGAPIGEDVLDYWQRRGQQGQLFFVSEYGFGGMDDVDAVLDWYGATARAHMEDYRGFMRLKTLREEQFAGTVWEQTFGTMEKLRDAAQDLQADAIRLHTEALRANPACGGLNLVQLIDSNAFEVDGVVSFTRTERKKAFAEVQRLNSPLVLIVHCAPFNICSGETVRVTVTLVNERHIQGGAHLSVRVQSPVRHEVFAQQIAVEARPWVSVLYDELVPVSGGSGHYSVEAALYQGETLLVEGDHFCFVVHPDDLCWPVRPLALFDPDAWLGQFLRERAVRCIEFDPGIVRPAVIVTTPFTMRTLRPRDYRAFLHVFGLVERGCTALFLGLPRTGEGMVAAPVWSQGHGLLSPLAIGGVFPFNVTEQPAQGQSRIGPYSWAVPAALAGTPVPDHPIFAGLPRGLMGAPYANVAPLHRIEADVRVTEDLGAVQIYAHGNGAIILTSLNLLAHVQKDALAEKLLANLVQYSDGLLPPELAAAQPETLQAMAAQEREYQDVLEKFFTNSINTGLDGMPLVSRTGGRFDQCQTSSQAE